MSRLEKRLRRKEFDWLVVEGDTNSALAAALTGAKLRIPVAHVEAGCRSFEPFMQEELNRKAISECSTVHFTPTENCSLNLAREGFPLSSIFLTGHPIVEVVEELRRNIDDRASCRRFDVEKDNFVLATLHREENVEDRAKLSALMRSLSKVPAPVVFPIHPRTKKRIRDFRLGRYLRANNIKAFRPLKYTDMLALIENAAFVITDSGGIQQEALILGTPCITARNTTEWVETVQAGANILAGQDESKILKTSTYLLRHRERIKQQIAKTRNPFGNGLATRRITGMLLRSRGQTLTPKPMNALKDGFAELRVIKIRSRTVYATKSLLDYASLIFDSVGRPFVPSRGQRLSRGQVVSVFGPGRILDSLVRHVEARKTLSRRRHSS